MKLKATLALCVLGLCMNSYSNDTASIEEQVVVTATKDEVESSRLSKKVHVVTKKEIRASGAHTAAELLQTVPGVIINQSGSTGSPVTLYLRGAKPGQTLIMIDGIEINDPMTPDMGVDLSSLTAANIEKIEVVYGSAATVYGSNAMGGVVNIITEMAENGGSILFEKGSFSTRNAAYSFRGGSNSMSFWVKGNHFKTDGYSSASENDGNTETDGFKNKSFSTGITKKVKNHTLTLSGSFLDSEGDLDVSGGAFGDDDNYTFDRKDTFLKGEWKITRPFGWDGHSTLSWSKADNKRHYLNLPSENSSDFLDSTYNGTITKISLHNSIALTESTSLSFGMDSKNEEGDSIYLSESMWGAYNDIFEKQDVTTNSLYILGRHINKDGLILEGGLRYDDHDLFGSEISWSAGLVKEIEAIHTRFRMNGGSSFKAPTLYQLFSPYGSTDLSPEDGSSFEVGAEISLLQGNGIFSISWYSNSFNNMIDFNPETYVYSNIAEADITGFETGLLYEFGRSRFSLFYNTFDTEDKTTGENWLRRPDKTLSCIYSMSVHKWSIHLEGIYTSSRDDIDFNSWPSQRVLLDSFTVFNATLGYEWTDHLTLKVRGQNITDEDYQWVYGYGTQGKSWYGGVSYSY